MFLQKELLPKSTGEKLNQYCETKAVQWLWMQFEVQCIGEKLPKRFSASIAVNYKHRNRGNGWWYDTLHCSVGLVIALQCCIAGEMSREVGTRWALGGHHLTLLSSWRHYWGLRPPLASLQQIHDDGDYYDDDDDDLFSHLQLTRLWNTR